MYIKNLSQLTKNYIIYYPKIGQSQKYGFGILDPAKNLFLTRIQGLKKAILRSQHDFFLFSFRTFTANTLQIQINRFSKVFPMITRYVRVLKNQRGRAQLDLAWPD